MWLMRYSTKPLSHDYKVINHVASLLYITVNQTICLVKYNFARQEVNCLAKGQLLNVVLY